MRTIETLLVAASLAAAGSLGGCSKSAPPAATAAAAAASRAAVTPPVATPPLRVGRVADLGGGVRRFGDDGWEPVSRNEPLSTGDRLATDPDGHAVVQVASTTVHLGPASELIVARLDDVSVRLRLDHGELLLRVRSGPHATAYSIETGDGFFVPQSPSLARVAVVNGQSFGATFEGLVRFEARDTSHMDIAAGQQYQEWRSGKDDQAQQHKMDAMPSGPVVARAQKDDASEQKAWASLAALGGGGAGPVSPELTGAADLATGGQWKRAGEGWTWWPATVAGGAPFHDGRWAWVPPWGWTWIDAGARGGFATTHYGRWTSQGGRWAWIPPAANAEPAFAPATVGWMKPAEAGGDASVAWVPLAPGEPVFLAAVMTPASWGALNTGIPYPHQPAAAGGERLAPGGPAAYANASAKGAVAQQPAGAMQSRQPLQLAKAAAAASAARTPPPGPPGSRGEIDGGVPWVEVR